MGDESKKVGSLDDATFVPPKVIPNELRVTVFTSSGQFSLPLPSAGLLTIGRVEADLTVDEASVSRQHAELDVERDPAGESTVHIRDLGSSNGTIVRGARLEQGKRVSIAIGEAVDLGQNVLLIQRPWDGAKRPRRLWTRVDFESRLEEEIERSRASHQPFSLLVIRSTLENYEVADIVSSLLRPYDLVSSFSAQELAILAVDSDEVRCVELEGEIRTALSDSGTEASIGGASFPKDGRKEGALLEVAFGRVTGEGRKKTADRIEQIVEDDTMISLYRLVKKVGPSDLTVLILGETGVGKEVVADALHRASPRAQQPLVKLNCAALAESLLESELFGHERGAFTSAEQTKPGLLESADGGTVFLDEVGELPISIQTKLLRVVEDNCFRRVGAVKPITIDVRFVSATNRDLEGEVRRGTFREDFYYRLAGFTLEVPPLRDRPKEIMALARAFAEGETFTKEAERLLGTYAWPGNVRELRNIVRRALLLSDGSISPEHLPVAKLKEQMVMGQSRRPEPSLAPVVSEPDEDLSPEALAERERIIEALRACIGNQTRAAKMLGMTRRQLISRIESYNLPRPRKRSAR